MAGNLEDLSATEILDIKEPESLFLSPDLDFIKGCFHILAKKWHPDVHKGEDHVFAHLVMLKEQAEKKVREGTWEIPGLLIIKDGKKTSKLSFKEKRKTDTGVVYFSKEYVTYQFNKDNKILCSRFMTRVPSLFTFANDDMKKEVQRYLPSTPITLLTNDKQESFLVQRKNNDLLNLGSVLAYYGGKLDGKHVAWILSSLYSTACYLQYIRFCHLDISLDNTFISPPSHTTSLLGGWGVGKKFDEPIDVCPMRTYELMGPDIRKSKLASPRIYLECIKALGRELLGDPIGTKLVSLGVPAPMAQYLRLPTTGQATQDYGQWKEILVQSFGKRRFVEMELTSEQLYRKG